MTKIILNSIRTPDGTVLISKYRNDRVSHKDKNGLLYVIDGGNDYLRRLTSGFYEDLSKYAD
jgi:hypothetical protein